MGSESRWDVPNVEELAEGKAAPAPTSGREDTGRDDGREGDGRWVKRKAVVSTTLAEEKRFEGRRRKGRGGRSPTTKLSGFDETIEAAPRDGTERTNHEVVTKTGPPVSIPEGKLRIRDSARIAMPNPYRGRGDPAAGESPRGCSPRPNDDPKGRGLPARVGSRKDEVIDKQNVAALEVQGGWPGGDRNLREGCAKSADPCALGQVNAGQRDV